MRNENKELSRKFSLLVITERYKIHLKKRGKICPRFLFWLFLS